MMDVDQVIKDERRAVVFDAIQAGLFATTVTVFAIRGDVVIVALIAMLLGSKLSSIVSRYRVIRWMRVVQTQDAVIEQLARAVDAEIPAPRPAAPRGPPNRRI